MPVFIYKAKTKSQQVEEGEIVTRNKREALIVLGDKGLFPFSLEEENVKEKKAGVKQYRKIKVKPQDITMITRQLVDLLHGGVPILRALRILQGQTGSRDLTYVLENISRKVQEGESFSESLKQYPEIFSHFFVSLIKAGEISGRLEEILTTLANLREKEEDIRLKLRSAMMYPLLVVLVGTATVVFLFLFVIPRMVKMFDDVGQVLPLPTRIVVELSSFGLRYWPVIVIAAVLTWLVVRRMLKTQKGKLNWSKFLIRVPYWGNIVTKVELSRFAGTTGMLLHNGVPILSAMRLVKDVMKNEIIKTEVGRIYDAIVQGSTLANSLKNSAVFPRRMTDMVGIGEESNTLDQTLEKIAGSYDREADRIINVSLTMLEPVTILVMGLVIGFMVIAMLLPIFEMNVM